MTIKLVSNEKIAETSSKGNQEKWLDSGFNCWYKLDQFGYEALAEALISTLLETGNIHVETPFTFVRYHMEKLHVHGRDRTGCVSDNFLKPMHALIAVNRLLTNTLGTPLKQKLSQLPSDKRRIAYLADAVAEVTSLKDFPRYLTLLFEVDALFCNDDRHLNNIAVIEQNGHYSYCPIFDNGAGLLSNTQLNPMDIAPKALISSLQARPFNTTFTRQMNAARSLYGKQLSIPTFTEKDILDFAQPLLEYYPARDRSIIAERVTACITIRQRFMRE
ncbi:MAG: hypothetical protein EOM30_03965 [Clostridia bacterium]|nr:hypothetical protein [Clostridia bacterium]NLS84605.1 hypothetical protein [Oscillospiraceae bacterium]